MKLHVIRSSMAKFHKLLRSPSILNKFRLNSTHGRFSKFLISNPSRIWRSFKNESCSLAQNLHSHILLKIFIAWEYHFWSKINSVQFGRNKKESFWAGPTHFSPWAGPHASSPYRTPPYAWSSILCHRQPPTPAATALAPHITGSPSISSPWTPPDTPPPLNFFSAMWI
jgi:hypothetical protein